MHAKLAKRTTHNAQRRTLRRYTLHVTRGNIVALALVLTSIILLVGIGIGIVVTEGSNRAQEGDSAAAAYYMANSGVEMQLYGVRKDNRTLTEVATASSSYPGGSKWVSTTGYEQTGTKVVQKLDKEQFTFADLFDPDNLASTFNVAKVTISWLPGDDCGMGAPDMELGSAEWKFEGGSVQWPTDGNYIIYPFSASPMSVNLDQTKQYRLRLRPYKCGAKNIQISMFNAGGAPLNYPGDITLGSEGFYGKTTQKVTVSMPRQDILSGLFSYIVFSQDKLCKKVGTAGVCN